MSGGISPIIDRKSHYDNNIELRLNHSALIDEFFIELPNK
jgi:hypothetical protein